MTLWGNERFQINATQGGWVVSVDNEPVSVVGSVAEALRVVRKLEEAKDDQS